MKMLVYIYNGILLSHKKNEILPLEAMGIDLKGIMLREISKRKKNTICYHLLWNQKNTRNVNKKETVTETEQTSGYQWRRAGSGEVRGTNYLV